MFLEGEKFIIKPLEESDKDVVCRLTHDYKITNEVYEKSDYSEESFWKIIYEAMKYHALIRKPDNTFLAMINTSADSEYAEVEIVAFNNSDLSGVAEDIFVDYLNLLSKEYAIESVIISSLQDGPDRVVYNEMGFDFDENEYQKEIDVPLVSKKQMNAILSLAEECKDLDEFKKRMVDVADKGFGVKL